MTNKQDSSERFRANVTAMVIKFCDGLLDRNEQLEARIAELETALNDECADTYGVGYKKAYLDLKELSIAKDARIAKLESHIRQQDRRIDELGTKEALARARVAGLEAALRIFSQDKDG